MAGCTQRKKVASPEPMQISDSNMNPEAEVDPINTLDFAHEDRNPSPIYKVNPYVPYDHQIFATTVSLMEISPADKSFNISVKNNRIPKTYPSHYLMRFGDTL